MPLKWRVRARPREGKYLAHSPLLRASEDFE